MNYANVQTVKIFHNLQKNGKKQFNIYYKKNNSMNNQIIIPFKIFLGNKKKAAPVLNRIV